MNQKHGVREKIILTDKQLFKAWEKSIENIQNTRKKHDENDKVYLARCWSNGIFETLIKEGYKLCLIKDGKEVVLEKV